jgi:phosphoglycolate phosphatase
MRFESVLFDLDGTLTNPAAGISTCIRHALSHLDVVAPASEDLHWCIGPPLRGSFRRLLATEDPLLVEEAMRLYRERFSDIGLFENEVYEGIPEALAELTSQGVRLYVATSKPEVFAVRILDKFGLSRYFEQIFGTDLEGRREHKGEVISHLIDRSNPNTPIMVGDRSHDVIGAKENGLPCLGVLYGFGSPEELKEAGAVALCETPASLVETLRTQ